MTDLTINVPLAKFESEEWLDNSNERLNLNKEIAHPDIKNEGRISKLNDMFFSEKFSHSLEDLVSSFDDKVIQCFKNYKENVSEIAPTQVREDQPLEEYPTWWTLTGNYGPFLPIDWNKMLARKVCLSSSPKIHGNEVTRKTFCKGRGATNLDRSSTNNDRSPFSTQSNVSEGSNSIASYGTNPALLRGGNRYEGGKCCRYDPNENGVSSADEIQIETADEVIKQINRMMKESPTTSQDSGVTPELFTSAHTGATFENDSAKYSSFLEPFTPYSREDLENLPNLRLEEVNRQLATYIEEQSETLVAELAHRDDLEFHKELVTTFISLLLALQNRKLRFASATTHNNENVFDDSTSNASSPPSDLTSRFAKNVVTSPMCLLNKLQSLVNGINMRHLRQQPASQTSPVNSSSLTTSVASSPQTDALHQAQQGVVENLNLETTYVAASRNAWPDESRHNTLTAVQEDLTTKTINNTVFATDNNIAIVYGQEMNIAETDKSVNFDEIFVDTTTDKGATLTSTNNNGRFFTKIRDDCVLKEAHHYQDINDAEHENSLKSDGDGSTQGSSSPFSDVSSPPPPPPPLSMVESVYKELSIGVPSQKVSSNAGLALNFLADFARSGLVEGQQGTKHISVQSSLSLQSNSLNSSETSSGAPSPFSPVTAVSHSTKLEVDDFCGSEKSTNFGADHQKNATQNFYHDHPNKSESHSTHQISGALVGELKSSHSHKNANVDRSLRLAEGITQLHQPYQAYISSCDGTSLTKSLCDTRANIDKDLTLEDAKSIDPFLIKTYRVNSSVTSLSSSFTGFLPLANSAKRFIKNENIQSLRDNLAFTHRFSPSAKPRLINHPGLNKEITSSAASKLEMTKAKKFKGTFLTTIIPYNYENGPPTTHTLQILIKLLTAILDDDEQVPSLLTDYILKIICPAEK